MHQELICGIDIGNFAVKTVIASVDRETLRPKVLGVGSVLSQGVSKGTVIDMEELVRNVRDSLHYAEATAGGHPHRVYVSLNGTHIGTQISRGVIIVARADNEISHHDIERVVDAASTINLPPNRTIIHRIPKNFIIDGQEQVRSALGMKGVRLEADVMLIEGLAPYVDNLARAVHNNSLEVGEFVFVPLALARSVLDKHQREHGVLNIDFGGGMSSMALFHEGELIHTAVFPIGSRHITNDIAVAFRIPMDKAEIIKCHYGSLATDMNASKEIVDISQLVGEENYVVPRKQINRIVEARVSELFDMIGNELKKVSYNYMLPAGVVLSGGGSNLHGMLQYTKSRLRLYGAMGVNYPIDNIPEQMRDPSFAVAAGLILWGAEQEAHTTGGRSFMPRVGNPFKGDGVKKVTKWLKNFMP